VQDWRDPEAPSFYKIGIWSRQDCQPYAPAAFTGRRDLWDQTHDPTALVQSLDQLRHRVPL
jgi:hypothetical protein